MHFTVPFQDSSIKFRLALSIPKSRLEVLFAVALFLHLALVSPEEQFIGLMPSNSDALISLALLVLLRLPFTHFSLSLCHFSLEMVLLFIKNRIIGEELFTHASGFDRDPCTFTKPSEREPGGFSGQCQFICPETALLAHFEVDFQQRPSIGGAARDILCSLLLVK